MENLYDLLRSDWVENFYALEEDLDEYKILFNFYSKISNKEFFLLLVISNSVVCYNLSKKSLDHWDKFIKESLKYDFKKVSDVYMFFIDFLPKVISDKDKISNRIQKIKDLKPLLDDMYFKQMYFYKNMDLLNYKLSWVIDMLFNEKIVMYAVKMYYFASRTRFSKQIFFPKDFSIEKNKKVKDLFSLYKKEGENIEDFYKKISEDLDIPEFHLWIFIDNKK